MSIRVRQAYQYGTFGERLRILSIDEETDQATTVSLGVQINDTTFKRRSSVKPKRESLSQLRNDLAIQKLVPVELTQDFIPAGALRGKAKEHADNLVKALRPLAETDPLKLCDMNLTAAFRSIATGLHLTPNAVNLQFTKVLQSGLMLAAVHSKWGRCGRHPALTDPMHCVAAPTKQPNSFPLSVAEIARIKAFVKKHHLGDRTWSASFDEFLAAHHISEIKVNARGQQIWVVKPPLKRPSLGQFYRHGRRSLGYVQETVQKVGAAMFERDYAGKPIGQAFQALMAGREAELDWTTSGLVTVRRGKRTSLGTITVYVIIDVFTGMVMSLYVTLGNASTEEANRAILICLEDKVELCKRYGVIIEAKDWAVKHIMGILTCDRGELNSWKASSLVRGLGCRLKTTRSRFARDKGTIESFNAKIKALMRTLAGGVEIYPRRGEKSPHIEAIFDLDQVYALLLELVIRHNAVLRANQPLSEDMVGAMLHHCPTPNALWDYGERHGTLRVFNLEEARLHVLPFVKASVTERGIQFEGLRYQVPTFDAGQPGGIDANHWLAEARKKRWPVDLLVDPATVNHVWLRHAPQGIAPLTLKCPLSEPQVASVGGLPWSMYRAIRHTAQIAKAGYREDQQRIANTLFSGAIKRITAEAREMTNAARAGVSKAALKRNIAENRAAEQAERAAAAAPAPVPVTAWEFQEDFCR
jgi:hypothetical protein